MHSRRRRDESERVHAAAPESWLRRADDLDEWRLMAKRVDEAWRLWLASGGRDGGLGYSAYLAALDAEEQAARRVEHAAARRGG